MQLRDAILEAIKSYWDGYEPTETKKSNKKGLKYTKRYFDKFEKDMEPDAS